MSDVSTWDIDANNNNQPPPDGFPEGQTPGSLNDCSREVMAAVARWRDGFYVFGNGYVTGNWGIGDNNPDTLLTIKTGSLDTRLSKTGTDAGSADQFGDVLETWALAGGAGQAMIRGRNNLYFGSSIDKAVPLTSDATMALTNAGVGIGGDPDSGVQLDVKNASAPTIQMKQTTNSITLDLSADASSVNFGTITNHPLFFRTNNVQRAQFSASGNFIITLPTTDPAVANALWVDPTDGRRVKSSSG